jgi:hypothetical protein
LNRLSPSAFAPLPFSSHFSQTAFTRPLFAMGFLFMHPLPFSIPLYLPFSLSLAFLSSPFTFFNPLSKISLFFFLHLSHFLSPSLLPILFFSFLAPSSASFFPFLFAALLLPFYPSFPLFLLSPSFFAFTPPPYNFFFHFFHFRLSPCILSLVSPPPLLRTYPSSSFFFFFLPYPLLPLLLPRFFLPLSLPYFAPFSKI